MEYTQEARVLKLTTPLGEDALIPTALKGREAISELFHFTLDTVWQDSVKPIDFNKILGQGVTIELALNEQVGSRFINGVVVSIAQGVSDRENDITHYVLEVAPLHWLLTRNTQIRIFQNLNVTDIIQKVIKALGLPSPTMKTQGTYSVRDYCVQYRESDFAFISRLMEQEGIYYYFDHTPTNHTLVLADRKSVFQDLPEGPDVEFEEVMSGVREDLRIFEWTKEQSIRTGVYTLRDWNFETPKLSLESNTKTVVSLPINQKMEVYEYSGKYMTPGDGEEVVKTRMQEVEAPGIVIDGKSWQWHFLPAYKFNLKGHFADKGKFVLTSLETSCTQPIGVDADEAKFQNHFTAIAEDVEYRPARVTPVPSIHGIQSAIVVGPSGEEIYTDKYGRIKVQFHWDREGEYNENSSCWIRVASAWAGKQWGMIHTPRIGQEVIVDFIDGDVDRPIVTGSVYNAEQMPPWTLPDNKTYSGVRSRSSKGADNDSLNEIRLDDLKGSEMFFMQAQKDMNIQVKHDKLEHIGNDTHLTVDKDSYTNVTGDVHVTVAGTQSTQIKTDINLKVDGKSATKIAGSHSVDVTGDVAEKFSQNHSEQTGISLYLKAGMTVVIEAGVQLSLKAAGSFVDIGPAGVTISGPLVLINSGGAAGSGTACNLVSALAPKAAQLPITTKATAVAALLSGGSQKSGSVSSSSGPAGSAPPVPDEPSPPRHDPDSEENKEKTHWVEIALVDESGQPLAGQSYEIKLPDGSLASGTTDEKGKGRVENIDGGSVDITFPDLDKDAWEPA